MSPRRDRPFPKEKFRRPPVVDASDPLSPTDPSAFQIERTKNLFMWSNTKRLAAEMLGTGDWLDSEIADRVGIARHTLSRWKMHPTFLAAVQTVAEASSQAYLDHAVTSKKKRLAGYDRLDMLLEQIREERAAAAVIAIELDPDLASVGGLRTGLIVRQDKIIGTGSNAQRTTEYKIDGGWIDAWLDLQKQVAQESGQWVTQQHVTGEIGVKMTVEDIRAAILGPQITDVTADYKELPNGD